MKTGKSLPVNSGVAMFVHRVPFSAEELLLLAGLSRALLTDANFRQAFHSNPVMAVRTDSLVGRLEEFLRVGVERNRTIRGNTTITRLVDLLLAPDRVEDEEFLDEQFELQP